MMDRDSIIGKASDLIAARSSRRGFLTKGGRMMLITAAVATGMSVVRPRAFASGYPACCNTPYACDGNQCPAGTHENGSTSCCQSHSIYTCTQCFQNYNGPWVCTAVDYSPTDSC